ncbi:hypothetical protein LTR22_017615 [Elasticomyces elasticus]|nr:hypothetical protein LTR22_017615 [Elasticomyces elasticus]KAK4905486.1 hypothetical protein LTR49_025221 [Elasticomyces elasticus]KAK5752568.1 hypothetical protein LTS12_017318 [Elasticomyces elasticus]
MTCLTTSCKPDSSADEDLTKMHMAYTPKIEYSCENSMVPGESPGANETMILDGSGNCETSPYAFRSFVAGTSSAQTNDMCRLVIYTQKGCMGRATSMSMNGGVEGCRFVGGRSARLRCDRHSSQSELPVSHLQALCSNAPAYGSPPTTSLFGNWTASASPTALDSTRVNISSTSPPSTTSHPSTTTAAPVTPTASGNITTNMPAPPAPYTGLGSKFYCWQGLSGVGLVAVGAAFAML